MVSSPQSRLFWYNFTKNMCSTPASDQQITTNKSMRSPKHLILIYLDRFRKDLKQIITKNHKIIFWNFGRLDHDSGPLCTPASGGHYFSEETAAQDMYRVNCARPTQLYLVSKIAQMWGTALLIS
jgi:hypothetical protein